MCYFEETRMWCDVRAWQERDRQAAEILKPSQYKSDVFYVLPDDYFKKESTDTKKIMDEIARAEFENGIYESGEEK